jgi:hypothetical protein
MRPASSLLGFLELERVADEVERRQVSLASAGLDGCQEQIVSDSLELLAATRCSPPDAARRQGYPPGPLPAPP